MGRQVGISLLAVVLLVGCETMVAYVPVSSSPEGQVVTLGGLQYHFVKLGGSYVAVGMYTFSSSEMSVEVLIRNGSDEVLHVVPTMFNAAGVIASGEKIPLTAYDPQDYIARKRAKATFRAILGAAAGVSAGMSSAPPRQRRLEQDQRFHEAGDRLRHDKDDLKALDESLLKETDVLPGQEIQGMLLLDRTHHGTLYSEYEIEVTLWGRDFRLSFRQQ